MCDPLIGGLVSGAASLIAGSSAQKGYQETQDAQNLANIQWVNYQNQIHHEQMVKEEQDRQMAENARQDTLQKVSPQTQQQVQQTEQQRLNALYNNPGGQNPTPNLDVNKPSSLALSGEQTGNTQFGNSLTSAVNNATAVARGRIAALATAGSYGGSFGGLGSYLPEQFAQGGNIINLADAMRRGNISTYGVEQQVQPQNFVVGPGTTQMASIAQSLGGAAGSLISKGISGLGSGGGWGLGGGSIGYNA